MSKRLSSDIQFTQSEIEIILKYFPNGICAFDLEMTGLSAIFDKIIEIAGVKITADGKIETFHSLVNPLIPIPEHTIVYHQLTNEDLRNSPTLKQPLREFLDFCGNTPLLAHNAMFDASFLFVGMNQFNFQPGLNDIYDSCKFARAVFKDKSAKRPESFKLSDLAQFFELEFQHHEALADAYICLKVFAKSLMLIEENTAELNLKDLAYIFKINSFKKPGDYILPNKLKPIKDMVQTQTVFEIKYKGGSVSDFRAVKPISILALPQGLVLYAECLLTHCNKHFKIKKIQGIKTS